MEGFLVVVLAALTTFFLFWIIGPLLAGLMFLISLWIIGGSLDGVDPEISSETWIVLIGGCLFSGLVWVFHSRGFGLGDRLSSDSSDSSPAPTEGLTNLEVGNDERQANSDQAKLQVDMFAQADSTEESSNSSKSIF